MAILRLCTRFLVAFWSLAPAGHASAQAYPAKVVRYVVADSPGGLGDAVGRIVASGLTEALGQQVVVENRTGAGANIGAAYAAKTPPDGYTLFQMSQTHTVNATLYRSLSYDVVRDFIPVSRLGWSPAMVVVHPSLPVTSLAELVTLARAQPGAIHFSSAGAGTPTHLSPELFRRRADIDIVHVPYRGGGEAITAVVSGEVGLYFAPLSVALQPARAGRLRALAVTSAARLPAMPELPTVAESGYPGFESGFWFGLAVPARTSKEIVSALHGAAVAALKKPDVVKRLDGIVFTPVGDQPEEFAAYIKSEIEKWGAVVKATGLTAN
jgi:tripartite-type tricarboxylate transporter receptor subunit TctC